MALEAGWQVATVRAVRMLTSHSRSITLRLPGWQGHLAGQHADVRLTAPDGYQAVRSYSLANWDAGELIELAVDRLPDGEVSPFLVDEIAVGDQVEILGPLGRWFVWRTEWAEPVQLIAGGSGLVPVMAMLRARAATGSPAPFRLLYSVRAPDDIYFRDELEQFGEQVDIRWIFTRSSPAGSRPAGRVTASDLTDAVFPPSTRARTYLCGSTGFVENVARMLTAAGHDESLIRAERYGGS